MAGCVVTSERVALVIAGLLALYNNLTNLLPQGLHDWVFIPLNLAALCLLLLWARSRGFSWTELGFSTNRMGSGVRWGIGLGLALPARLLLVLMLPESVRSLADPRDLGGLSMAALAYQTLMRIPLGTALFEEAAFRGVLYGVWARGAGARRAFLGSSIAFGLWHVTPTFELMDRAGIFPNFALLALGVVAGVLAYIIGGLLFAWLRQRSGAIYGSMLSHWLISALGGLAASLYGR